MLKAIYDEGDAAYGALGTLWTEIESGGLRSIEDVDGLMGMYEKALASWISAVADHEFAEKRGGPGIRCGRRAGLARRRTPHPQVRTISPDDLERLESDTPPPERALMQAETLEQLLALLNARQRELMGLRLEGLTIEQIHMRMGLSRRTIERSIQRVRDIWGASGFWNGPGP